MSATKRRDSAEGSLHPGGACGNVPVANDSRPGTRVAHRTGFASPGFHPLVLPVPGASGDEIGSGLVDPRTGLRVPARGADVRRTPALSDPDHAGSRPDGASIATKIIRHPVRVFRSSGRRCLGRTTGSGPGPRHSRDLVASGAPDERRLLVRERGTGTCPILETGVTPSDPDREHRTMEGEGRATVSTHPRGYYP